MCHAAIQLSIALVLMTLPMGCFGTPWVFSVNVLDTCSPENFQASCDWVIENQLFNASNLTASARTFYKDFSKARQCTIDNNMWSLSQKPLVVNVGSGTTGTRWLDEVMGDLGFHTAHWKTERKPKNMRKPHPPHLGYSQEDINGSFEVDQYDFISDTPVSTLTWQILQSHPNALFIMTVRDPMEWHDTRIASGRMGLKTQGVPCGQNKQNNTPYGTWEDLAQMYVVYSVWAQCVLPRDRFLMVNVFANATADNDFIEKLIPFLEKNGLQKRWWKKRVKRVKDKLRDKGSY